MDIRKAIIDQLEQQGHSRYWLAQQLEKRGVCTANFVYCYLRGENDMTGKILGEAMDIVGLKLKH